MAEQMAQLPSGIEICYETFGDPDDPALLLVMGLGGPLTWWNVELCSRLADRGFFVIRFDNRDIGRSSRIVPLHRPSRRAAVTTWLGVRRHAEYSLSDLADDAFGLLDHLDVERAHLFGVSMGGMIAQTMAIARPTRVPSLVSMMSTTGRRSVGWQDPRLFPMLLAPTPRSRDEYVARAHKVAVLIGSPGYPVDAEDTRIRAEETWDRGYHAAGVLRQMLAVISQPDRTPALRELDTPTCVIHGLADRMVHNSGGRATAAAVRGAELVLLPRMGHDLPAPLYDTFVDAVARTARRADGSAPTRTPSALTPSADTSRMVGRRVADGIATGDGPPA
jgi:pimeloyl-ACP methyl ester carboxylesterase